MKLTFSKKTNALLYAIFVASFASGCGGGSSGSSSSTVSAPPVQSFYWGVCLHAPVDDTASNYSYIPVATQISEVQTLGAAAIRVDFRQPSYDADKSAYISEVNQANSAGITVMPILYETEPFYPNPVSQGAVPLPPDPYQNSYNYGHEIATDMGSAVKFYELSNERGDWALVSGDGRLTSNFDVNYLHYAMREIEGMHDGVKAANPNAQTIVDVANFEYGFLDYLQTQGASYDILAWHYYVNQSNYATGKDVTNLTYNGVSYGNVWQKLQSYGKPIMVNEFNYQNAVDDDPMEATYITYAANEYRGLSGCMGAFVYELLDEPWLPASSGSVNESTFGLVHVNSNGSGGYAVGTPKAAFTAYQQAIAQLH